MDKSPWSCYDSPSRSISIYNESRFRYRHIDVDIVDTDIIDTGKVDIVLKNWNRNNFKTQAVKKQSSPIRHVTPYKSS